EELAKVAVFVPGEVVAVRLAERPQPLDLQALPGVVLPHQLARGEADALAAREQRFSRPPLTVAFEREEQGCEARGAEPAGSGDRLDVGEHGAELSPPGAAEPAEQAFCGDERRKILAVGRIADRAGGAQ